MKSKFLIFFLTCCFCSINIIAQTEQITNAPIKEVLLALEKKHNVKFSYSENLITNKIISLKIFNALEENLKVIESKTNLIFQIVDKRYIIISDKNTLHKTTICGYVLKKKSQEPLVGASIVNSNKLRGTFTNKKGYFNITLYNLNDLLNVSFIGYKTKFINLNSKTKEPCFTILLEEENAVLNEVLIVDYLTNGISQKTNGAIQISPKEISAIPGLTEPDVLQSIQALPGVQNPNETASGLYIRGGTPDQNLILFDDIKIYNTGHLFGMISAINPYITEKVKVFRSGAGASYGNHISGVVDIESDNDLATKTSGGFGFNLTHADAFINTPISKKVSVLFSARRSFTDVFKTNTFNQLSKKVFQNTIISRDNEFANNNQFNNSNDFYFTDFTTKIIFNHSVKDNFSLNYLFVKNQLDYQFKLSDNTYNTRDILNTRNQGINSKWIRKWKENLIQKTNLYYSDFSLDYNFVGQINSTQQNQTSVKNNYIKELGFKTSFNYIKNSAFNYNFGYEFTNNNVNYKLGRTYSDSPSLDYLTEENNKNNSHEVFGEFNYLKENFSFNLGLRGSYFSLTDKVFVSPRVYSQLEVLSNFWLKSSFEIKQQNISQVLEFSTSDFGLENQIWALAKGNEISLLESNQITFGFLFKRNDFLIDIDFYRKESDGITSFNSNEVFYDGKSTSLGIDVLLQKKWQQYSSWISYSFGENWYTFPNLNRGDSFVGNFNISHSFLWSHNMRFNNFDFALGWNFRTGIPYTKALNIDANDNIVFEKINNSSLPNYHKLDFSSTYSFNFDSQKKWKGKVGLSLLNVYGQQNILQQNYSVDFDDNNDAFILTEKTYSLGFTPNVVLRVNF